MMKIFFDGRILQNPYLSGVGYYTQQVLCGLLGQSGVQLKIFSNSFKPGKLALPICLTSRDEVLSTSYPNQLLTLAWSMGSWPRIDHLTADSDLIFCPHIGVLPRQKKPKVVTIHDLSYEHFPQFLTPRERFWHRLSARAARDADHFIAVSHATRDDLIRVWGIPGHKVSVIYSGCPDLSSTLQTSWEQMTSRLGIREPYILSVGTLEPRKNLVRLVRAFSLLLGQPGMKDLQLVLAGHPGSDTPNIRREIGRLQLEKLVTMTGYVNTQDKVALYRHASLLAYPSLYEGFGFPLLEAMQLGVPVVAANVSAIPEVTGAAALLVDPYRVDHLSEALSEVLSARKRREDMISAGQNQYKKFSWDTCSREIHRLCQKS